jgi:hypothetical protein
MEFITAAKRFRLKAQAANITLDRCLHFNPSLSLSLRHFSFQISHSLSVCNSMFNIDCVLGQKGNTPFVLSLSFCLCLSLSSFSLFVCNVMFNFDCLGQKSNNLFCFCCLSLSFSPSVCLTFPLYLRVSMLVGEWVLVCVCLPIYLFLFLFVSMLTILIFECVHFVKSFEVFLFSFALPALLVLSLSLSLSHTHTYTHTINVSMNGFIMS